MARLPSDETLRAFEAFEFWFYLQPRSFEKVAVEFKVTHNAVRKWHAKFDWDRRAQEREAKLKAAISDRNDAEAIKARTDLIRVADATIARYAARLLRDPEKRAAQGVSAYEPTAGDASRWAQMKLLLTGQATSRPELSLGVGFVDVFLQTVKAVLRRDVPRCCPTCKTDLDLPERVGRALVEASARLQAEQGGAAGVPAPPAAARPGLAEDPDAAGPDAA